MTTEQSNITLAGYEITSALTPAQTFLATDAAGRRVVLKILESDCLLRGRLHPNIHDRLARVRELAHVGVANLLGVERSGGRAFAVWEYIPGTPLDEYVKQAASPADLAAAVCEIILAVESMHSLGIIHGRIHSGNVIIDSGGRVRLTHVSPLLYDDPAADAHDLCEMVRMLCAARGWSDSPLGRAVAGGDQPLGPLRVRITQDLSPTSWPPARQAADAPELKALGALRARLYSAAAVTALLGAAVALAVVLYAMRAAPPRPVPPKAPPAAFEPP